MATIFSQIIEGNIPGTFVWKDDQAVAFMSINPLNTGHTLVVPRAEIDHWLDLPTELAQHLMAVSHSIAKAQQQAFNPARVGLAIAGFEVPHCHIHVVPMHGMHHLDFANAAATVYPAELETAAEAIRSALRELDYSQVSE